MLTFLCLLIACHFIGDFPFQGEFMALNKGKSWEINFYHAITYTATFIIFAKVSVVFAAVLLLSHFLIDPLKARFHIVKSIWMDQLFHIAVILSCIIFGL